MSGLQGFSWCEQKKQAGNLGRSLLLEYPAVKQRVQ